MSCNCKCYVEIPNSHPSHPKILKKSGGGGKAGKVSLLTGDVILSTKLCHTIYRVEPNNIIKIECVQLKGAHGINEFSYSNCVCLRLGP